MRLHKLEAALRALLAYQPSSLPAEEDSKYEELLRLTTLVALAIQDHPAGVRLLEERVTRVMAARRPASPFGKALAAARDWTSRMLGKPIAFDGNFTDNPTAPWLIASIRSCKNIIDETLQLFNSPIPGPPFPEPAELEAARQANLKLREEAWNLLQLERANYFAGSLFLLAWIPTGG
jgi:hypothetical protein